MTMITRVETVTRLFSLLIMFCMLSTIVLKVFHRTVYGEDVYRIIEDDDWWAADCCGDFQAHRVGNLLTFLFSSATQCSPGRQLARGFIYIAPF